MKLLKVLIGFFLIFGIFAMSGTVFANNSPNKDSCVSAYMVPDVTLTAASVPLLKGGGGGGRGGGSSAGKAAGKAAGKSGDLSAFGWFEWLFIAVATIIIVIIAIIYGKTIANWSRRNKIILGVVILLLITVPTYVYFTAAEDITVTSVTSKNSSWEIINYKAYRNTFSGTDVIFGGYVKNNGATSAEYVQVNATGYDAAGNVVTNDTFYVDDTILPGGNSPFGYLGSKYGGYLEDPQKKIVSIKLEAFKTSWT